MKIDMDKPSDKYEKDTMQKHISNKPSMIRTIFWEDIPYSNKILLFIGF